MENKDHERNENMGGFAGLGAGVITGAQVGTVLIPVPFLGTFAGALVGGVVGTAVGQRVGAAALDGLDAFLKSMSSPSTVGPKPTPVDHREPGNGTSTEAV